MGLISAALGAAGGVAADQWKELFYCESIPADVLVVKGSKRATGRSSNYKGSDNIITSGSYIDVADGQCMIIVEQGKVVDLCAEPGTYKYDSTLEPSIFDGGRLSDNIRAVFRNIGKRFTFGGEAPNDQRIYYFNTKEIIGNKYGTPSPVPFTVIDNFAHFRVSIRLRCFGEYSYRITNPILFYTNVCGNVSESYGRSEIDGQLKSEMLTALQPAFARLSEMGIEYASIIGHTRELAAALREELNEDWSEHRGITIERIGMSSIKAEPEDEKRIQDLQQAASLHDPASLAAYMGSQQGQAVTAAASNTAGAATGFMGMGMAQAMGGGANLGDLFAASERNRQASPAAAGGPAWVCSCGASATGNFCPQCGAKKPAPAAAWTCPKCGASATGKFCPECGAKKPEGQPDGWTCSCGAVNKGRFCSECGAKKPAEAPLYRCDKCGWEPKDPHHPPKFCPECGDPFDDADVVAPEA